MYWDVVFYAIFVLGCLVHSYTDFKEQLLYDEVSLVMLLAGICYRGCLGDLEGSLWGGVATGAGFLLLYIASRGGMGMGDVKLAVVLGVWLDWQQGLLSLLISLLLGCFVGILMLATTKKSIADAIPFGPYMCISGCLMLRYGKQILAWYIDAFI